MGCCRKVGVAASVAAVVAGVAGRGVVGVAEEGETVGGEELWWSDEENTMLLGDWYIIPLCVTKGIVTAGN